MVAWLAIALWVAPGTDTTTDAAKAAFKKCIETETIDTVVSGTTVCLQRYRDATANTPTVQDEPIDPIAKRVADDEADTYTLLLTAERYDPQALCVQAGLTARAYLDAKMMTQYDRWKANERRSCGEAATAGRRRD